MMAAPFVFDPNGSKDCMGGGGKISGIEEHGVWDLGFGVWGLGVKV